MVAPERKPSNSDLGRTTAFTCVVEFTGFSEGELMNVHLLQYG